MDDWDWADKIAWYFASEFDDCTKSDEQIDVAAKLSTALRKAKADGEEVGFERAIYVLELLGTVNPADQLREHKARAAENRAKLSPT